MDEFNTVVMENSLVVVKFYTPTCPPCNMLKPKLEELEKRNSQITFVQVNCSLENSVINKHFEIYKVPVIVCIKHGKEVSRTFGGKFDEIKKNIMTM